MPSSLEEARLENLSLGHLDKGQLDGWSSKCTQNRAFHVTDHQRSTEPMSSGGPPAFVLGPLGACTRSLYNKLAMVMESKATDGPAG